MSAETEIANLLYRSDHRGRRGRGHGQLPQLLHGDPADQNDFPLQVIVAGRYRDHFQLVDGRWRFAFRDYSLMDMIGDVSHHLNRPIAEIGGTA